MASKITYASAAQIASSQKVAQSTSSTIGKATKALIIIISGFSGLFLLKILRILMNKKNNKITEDEATSKISAVKSQWQDRITKSVEDSWTKGILIGMAAAKEQGVKPKGSGSSNSEVLQSIINDTKRAIGDADRLLRQLVESGQESDVDKINKAITLRLQMSGEAALKFAVADTMESELASPDTKKMWVSTNPLESCSHCTRLNGMIRDWGEEFPHSFPGITKLKVYGGILLGPLRHPNCRCILVAVPKEK